MDNNAPKDKALYDKVVQAAKKKYKRYPSLYASAWIQKEYQRLGGQYEGKQPTKKQPGISRWFKEQWIQVGPYLKDGTVVECGEGQNNKACRPLKRVTKDTPPTLPELIEKHGEATLRELAAMKRRYPKGRVDWVRASFKKP